MAYFRPQFQIPVLTPTQLHSRLTPPLNVRSLWIWRSSEKKAIEKPSDSGCKRPSAAPIQLCTGGPSKCLEKLSKKPKRRFFFFPRKSDTKELAVSKEPRKVERKLSLKERVFGPDPRRSWPDPCTCRLIHRRKRMCRAMDPRLKDPRYQATPGDVLLYTELPKCQRHPCLEPQPKPPPAFKLPKAVLCKLMVEASEKVTGSSANIDTLIGDNNDGRTVETKTYKIPFEEMRPPEKRRKPFTCKEGIRPEDVPVPVAIETNSCAAMYQGVRAEFNTNTDKTHATSDAKVTEKKIVPKAEKRSRIEQLKIVVQEKITTDRTYPHR